LKKLPRAISEAGARSVAIFYDAAALRLPLLYPNAKGKFQRYLVSLSNFDLVICASEASHGDLLQLWSELGVAPTETVVETLPVETNVSEQHRPGKGSRALILCVGSFEPRKNHLTLLRAADALWEAGLDFDLEFVGRSAGSFGSKVKGELRRLDRSGRPIRWLKQVNDDVLHRAYRECRFTVYPSLMEGFGLPIAESLVHGKPCICGGNGALGEVARGGGCLIVDQSSVDALANGIKTLLLNRQLYSRVCDEARGRRFRSWSDYTNKLMMHLHAETAPAKSFRD
ncbi:MAG: glycosyltransferase family 4 protein, partial [Verrucomicrobia bacterium]|nr:glycosyltransferase family 4 protein [Verrucomicrobiota bacterium]